jgi:large subunit ribosomal protein L24e
MLHSAGPSLASPPFFILPRPTPQVFKFCRSKCHRGFQKKRNPRKIKWTKAFRKAAGKEMKVDATFEFQKKRNKPVRYDRDLMTATITTMKRVTQIQQAREKRFYENRMRGRKAAEQQLHKVEIATNINLVKPVAARKREEKVAKEKLRLKESEQRAMEEDA